MFKNLRKIVLGLLAVCLTGALGAGVAFGIEAHAEEAVASVKAFKSTQINLNESITVRYNLTVPAGYTGAEMTFTVGEGGSPITAEPKTGLTEGQNITFELKNIGPQNMADTITATVTFTGKNGETGVETYETSVKKYCQTLLKNAAAGKADRIDAQEKFDALKTLASSLLVYGDEAQKYVGKEATSTTGLTVAQKNAALKAQASSSDLSFSGEAYKGLLWSGATLWFGNKVNLIYYFKADSALQAQGALGVKVGESFIEAQVGETVDGYTEYSATYEGLSVTEFDSVIGARVAYKTTDGVVTEVGKTANYSVKSYVLRAPEADKALAEAAYSYGVAAKAYTEALGNTEKTQITLSTGEYFEYTGNLTLADMTVNKIESNNHCSNYAKSIATDGNYGFVSSAYNESNKASVVYVVKFDLNTNKELGYAKVPGKIDVTCWSISQDLFVYKNTLYFVSGGNDTVYEIAISDIDSTGKEMNKVESFFKSNGGTIYADAAAYDASSDRFVVRQGHDVYVGSKDNLVKKFTLDNEGSSIYADENYIYAFAKTHNSDNVSAPVTLRIFTWNGVEKTVGWQQTGIVPMGGALKNEIPGMFAVNGKVYFLVCQFGNGNKTDGTNVSNGAYIVSGYLDTSKIAQQ